MSPRLARWSLGLGFPLLALVLGFGPLVLFASELPPKVASHFTLDGRPDGSMELRQFAWALGAMLSIGLLPCITLALWPRPLPPGAAPLGAFLGGFVAFLGAGILAVTCLSQRGLSDWRAARMPEWELIGFLGPALLAAAAGAWLGQQLPTSTSRSPKPSPTPAMHLKQGERAVWTRTLRVPWVGGLGLLLILLALAGMVARLAPGSFALPMLLAGLVTLSFSRVRARADREGLQVRYGWLPWPRTKLPIEAIESASAIEVNPLQWGGWGYRGSLKLAKRAAVVLRRGPGLRLDLSDGSVFVITVEDPDVPAALLNALVQAQ